MDLDFARARRRAWLGRLKTLLLKRGARRTLLSSEEVLRHIVLGGGSMYRGTRAVKASRIVGSVGKHEQFDPDFMPLAKAFPEKWKRIDRAYVLGQELPPVSLLEVGEEYFVDDGNNRVSVARFHGVQWIDAEVTEPASTHLLHVLHHTDAWPGPLPIAVTARPRKFSPSYLSLLDLLFVRKLGQGFPVYFVHRCAIRRAPRP